MISSEVMTEKKKKQAMQVDECAQSQVSLEQLNKLPPGFKKEGTATAKSVPGVSDAVIVNEDAVKKHNLTLLARIVGYFVSGCNPSNMNIVFDPGINGALRKTKPNFMDMDLMERNAVFAPSTWQSRRSGYLPK